jgi:hypothetical protein
VTGAAKEGPGRRPALPGQLRTEKAEKHGRIAGPASSLDVAGTRSCCE